MPHMEELRAILASENERETKRFKDLDWRLSLVTGCRARQKTMVPKFTMKLDLQTQGGQGEGGQDQTESYVLDCDYTNLKRI